MPWPPALSARWAALALFLFALGLHLALAVGFMALAAAGYRVDINLLIIGDELGAILAAPLLMALLLRLRLRDAFLLRRGHWSHYAIAIAAAVPLQVFGGAVQELTIEAMPNSEAWREMLQGSLDALTRTEGPLDFALLLLGGVALAAICEEILFRGMLLQLLARGGRWRSAILVTAVLFALFHLEPIGLLPRTLMGIYFALLVWRSGSIFPAMLAHGANNLLAFAALPLADPNAGPPPIPQVALMAVGGGLVFALALGLWLRLSPAPTPPSTGYTGDDTGPGPGPLAGAVSGATLPELDDRPPADEASATPSVPGRGSSTPE